MQKLTRLSITLLLILLVLFLFQGLPQTTARQEFSDSVSPPTILSFTVDVESVTVTEAEAGTKVATFSWQTTGMTEDYHLELYAYEIGTWVYLLDEDTSLAFNGSHPVAIHHPLNFNDPTYRLIIMTNGEDRRAISESTLAIPLVANLPAEDSDTTETPVKPVIDSFTSTEQSVSADDLYYGNARIPVSWSVSDRIPKTNLVFEQVLSTDGTGVSIELPRANLWISSTGSGEVAPQYQDGQSTVMIRLRVVDVLSGETLDEAGMALNVTGAVSTPTPTRVPPTSAPQQAASSGESAESGEAYFSPAASAGGAASGGFEIGGHVQGFGRVGEMQASHMTWVKKQIRWSRGEGTGAAAAAINEAHAHGFKILLGVVGYRDQMGDFENYTDEFAVYIGQVAALGPDAIEVWNEPNIDREWPAGTINGTNYTRLLSKAYNAIKTANSGVIVISAAPAPTGYFGGGCANAGCDDNVFLAQMARAGAASYLDCVGAHYNEGIISPDQTSGDPRGGHYSRYFWGMLNLYYGAFGGTRKVCWTELGFLSPEGYGQLPGQFAWAQNTTVAQHAEWLGRAAALSRSSGKVRLMIVWNVDFTGFGDDPQGGYAIVRPDGSCPACGHLAAAMQ